jgi:hypothetical protein
MKLNIMTGMQNFSERWSGRSIKPINGVTHVTKSYKGQTNNSVSRWTVLNWMKAGFKNIRQNNTDYYYCYYY